MSSRISQSSSVEVESGANDSNKKRERNEEINSEDNLDDTSTARTTRSSKRIDTNAKKEYENLNTTELELLKTADGDGDDDGDWKRPLFYWKGDLTFESKTGKLIWKGSWVSDLASNGLPEPKEFIASNESNSFHLTSTKVKDTKKGKSGGVSQSTVSVGGQELLNFLRGKSGSFSKGSYLLDQGDGLGPTKQRDFTHNFTFDSSTRPVQNGEGNSEVLFITASGTTAFGSFVSAGYITGVEGSRVELVLARRHIDEDDSRHSLVRSKSHGMLFLPGLSLEKEEGSSNKLLLWTAMVPRNSDANGDIIA